MRRWAEIERLQKLLLGFDRYCANLGPGVLPRSVYDIVFAMQGRIGTAQELQFWQTAADVLCVDPQAVVTVDDPPPPPPPPERAPASYQVPHVRDVLAAQAKAREQVQAETPPEAAA
jgi:hypothetical protein